MSKASLLAISAALGVTAGSLGLATPAFAVQLTLVQDEPYAPAPSGWVDLGWKVEGRAGAPLGEDYEFAIGPDGAQANKTDDIYRDWNNGETVDWSFNWDGQTAKFTLAGEDIFYSLLNPSPNIFNGFSLLTNVDTRTYDAPALGERRVEEGTAIDLIVETLNGEAVNNIFSNAIGQGEEVQNLSKKFFSSSETINSLAGTVKVSWLSIDPNEIKARSRVSFQLEGYDFNGEQTSIPEPTSILSLLAFGAFGIGSVIKRRQVN
ncbi:choice-of-anchor W domain-containing protein [Aerosakkonemataceae cyanobacterium BLCC-F154]|uniref:Choice-of-anchor W domain-containing protein n=1 Tax=Floridaenema fluviatile BLCC-F154 TaxID=3153640 RepID=A0ABV4YG55_9CYAN